MKHYTHYICVFTARAMTAMLSLGILSIPMLADDPIEEVNACIADNQTSDDYMMVIQAYLATAPVSNWTRADCMVISPTWTGDDNHGQLFTPLWRGAATAIEDWVVPSPPGSYPDLKGTVRLDWDKAANTLHYTIKLHHVPISPPVNRVDGGNPEITDPTNPLHFINAPYASWWFNLFHQNPKDLPIKASDGTAYRLWTIFLTYNTSTIGVFYDPQTLMLLGSAYQFPSGPPEGAIAIGVGENVLASSLLMYPDSSGFATRQYTVPYSGVTTEGGYHGYFSGLFAPQNLCRSNEYQPALGQLRALVSPWQPPSAAKPWNLILDNGLFFDLTVEEGRPDVPPGADDQNLTYIYSAASILSQAPSAPGGTPWGYHSDLPAVIQNVQPTISQVPREGGFVGNPMVSAPLYCMGQQ